MSGLTPQPDLVTFATFSFRCFLKRDRSVLLIIVFAVCFSLSLFIVIVAMDVNVCRASIAGVRAFRE